MNSSEPIPDARIEAFLDGMLSPEETSILMELERADPAIGVQMDLARDIQRTLRQLPAIEAPPDLVPSVLRIARSEARRDALRRVRSWLGLLREVNFRPILATASLVAVIVASGIIGQPPDDRPTDPEVAEALEQIKWTLALVSQVGEDAALKVRDDVLAPHVVAPMQQAMHTVFEDPAPIRN